MPCREPYQWLVFRVFGFTCFLLCIAWVGQSTKSGTIRYVTSFDKRSLERFVLELLGLVGHQQRQRALFLRQRAGCAVHYHAKVIQAGQPDMALSCEAGLWSTKLSLLKRAVAQHFEQVCASQCGLLVPEKATFVVAVAAYPHFKFSTSMRVAKSSLVLEQQSKLMVKQNP